MKDREARDTGILVQKLTNIIGMMQTSVNPYLAKVGKRSPSLALDRRTFVFPAF
jgi:hypothetical protein